MNGWQWTVPASGALLLLIIIFSFEYWLDKRITRVGNLRPRIPERSNGRK
jgi:hypothetical protein